MPLEDFVRILKWETSWSLRTILTCQALLDSTRCVVQMMNGTDKIDTKKYMRKVFVFFLQLKLFHLFLQIWYPVSLHVWCLQQRPEETSYGHHCWAGLLQLCAWGCLLYGQWTQLWDHCRGTHAAHPGERLCWYGLKKSIQKDKMTKATELLLWKCMTQILKTDFI